MNKEAFIEQIAPAAQANMLAFGILASVTTAQAILESGWGLQQAGYATDPHYADKLITIIEGSDLTRFDQVEEEREYLMSSDDANKMINFLSAAWMSTEDVEASEEFPPSSQ
ncbi:hypothetical protein ASL11_01780 [Paenibacillus sp. Soil750]|nr:glucosaminidase domain-containing protein [Paenibacillus sp. Soil750]KRE75586.1 hypothetical protein ASL11_01780 [Paenibacillus sp. Soil750]